MITLGALKYICFIKTGGSCKADVNKTTASTLDDSNTLREPAAELKLEPTPTVKKTNPLLEKWILVHLSDKNLSMPVSSLQLNVICSKVSDEL